ncbi:Cholecystokinin receptor [Orchesella cincta]|uniref:Cholecystokinin receptor n=1 Tax=Orchesella cincta TaxID=48709 RepID=A0A1D2MHZ1_ORCCI|nr:Cholecystokinin receptor [Orchesella cincta]
MKRSAKHIAVPKEISFSVAVGAISVSVSAWTLVAISVERYYAICHPLTSRRWQTLSHAYKIIAVVWVLSMLCMSPIAFVNMLQPIRKTGRHKCREEWPDETLEKTYTVFLDMILLVLPLFIMAVKYGLITRTLWPAATHNDPTATGEQSSMLGVSAGDDAGTPTASPLDHRINNSSRNANSSGNDHFPTALRRHSTNSVRRFRLTGGSIRNVAPGVTKGSLSILRQNLRATEETPPPSPSATSQGNSSVRVEMGSGGGSFYGGHQVQVNSQSGRTLGLLRRSNAGKSLSRKKRVIQMLGVVVLEFFVCWTPLYVMNTWYLFSPEGLYETIGPLGVSLIHLLSYSSSCSNPITYCFMNKSFRVAFCHVFGCHCSSRNPPHMSAVSHRNDSLRLSRNRSLYAPSLKTTDDV